MRNKDDMLKKNDGNASGLKCPKCGCRHFETVRTQRVGSHVRRYRRCRYCGKVSRTREVIE